MTPGIGMLVAATSAPVTQWPERLMLVGLVLVAILAALWGMRRGWRRRADRQVDLSAPAPAPSALTSVDLGPVPGVYLGSTFHGDWLDRIVVHEMGVRSRASCEVGYEGILLRREGARDLFVPAENLFSVGTARGIAGKAYERGGVLVVTWDLGDKVLDTGFRADAAEDQESLLAVLQGLVGQQTPAEEGTT